MANHTAAERERIRKKRRRERIILEVVIVLALAVFIFVCERRGGIGGKNSSQPTEAPVSLDERVEYLKRFADSGIEADDKAARLALDNGGLTAQLIVSGASAPFTVAYRSEFERIDPQSMPTSLFPNVDRPTASPETPYPELEAFCDAAEGYFIPLFPEGGGAGLAGKLYSALLPVYVGESDESGFIFGVYVFGLEYDSVSGSLTVTASPAS